MTLRVPYPRPVQPVALSEDQLEPALGVVVRAFHRDPGFVYGLPNEARRERLLRRLLRAYLLYGHGDGEVYTTPGEPRGVAVWLPPPGRGAANKSFSFQVRGALAMTCCWPAEWLRLQILWTEMFLTGSGPMHRPHWYLGLLGVEPEHQGKGLGSALLRPVLERADAKGFYCGLDTLTESNVRFYERHGFRVAASRQCSFGGPTTWAMWREPGG